MNKLDSIYLIKTKHIAIKLNINKFYVMRETLQFVCFVKNTNMIKDYYLKWYLKVKMSFIILCRLQIRLGKNIYNKWRQSAWFSFTKWMNNYQWLEIKQYKMVRFMFTDSKLLNKNKDEFYKWFVGFTDGDGSFSICGQKTKEGKWRWSLFFKISQSNYNMRVLYFIKKQLGCGSVIMELKTNNADFRIRDKNLISKVIFPIFDKFPLLTSKYFDYIKFKKAYFIMIDLKLSKEEKDNLLLKLKEEKKSYNYISPIWKKINYEIKNTNDANIIMNKEWLIGFTEAEGSFYLVKKSPCRLVHGFEITQKLDLIVLKSIAVILGISVKNKKKYNTVVTTNSRAISNIINYYKNTMKGMKALEYKIWAKSYIKYKGNFLELNKIRNFMRDIRLIRLDKWGSIDIKKKK